MNIWSLQNAKAHLSQLVQLTLKKGPQMISIRGEPQTVMISKKDYEILKGEKDDFLTFMGRSPLKDTDLNITRDSSFMRDIEI